MEHAAIIIRDRAKIGLINSIHKTHKLHMKELEEQMHNALDQPLVFKYVAKIEYNYNLHDMIDVHDLEVTKVILHLIRHCGRRLGKLPINIDETKKKTINAVNKCIGPSERNTKLDCTGRVFNHWCMMSGALCDYNIGIGIYECGYIDASNFNSEFGEGLAQDLIQELRNSDIKEASDAV